MSATASPARTAPGTVLGAAWFIMLGGGGTNMVFNVYHSVHGGSLNLWLALLFGVIPPLIAMAQSHIVAEYRGAGPVLKAITFLLMAGAMTASASATAEVLWSATNHEHYVAILFPAVLDAGALVALYVILNYRSRQAAEADEITRAQAAVAEARAQAVQADAAGSAAAGQLAEAAEREQVLTAELAAVRAELQAVRDAERERRRSGTKGGTRSGTRRRSTAGTGGGTKGGTGPGTEGGTDDLSMEARALAALEDPAVTNGTKLAEHLGVSDGYGRRLWRKLASQNGEPSEPGSGR